MGNPNSYFFEPDDEYRELEILPDMPPENPTGDDGEESNAVINNATQQLVNSTSQQVSDILYDVDD